MKTTRPALLLALAAFFLADLSAHAANLPPERFLALPDLVVARGQSPAPIPLADHLRDPDVPGTAARISVRLADQIRTIDLALHDDAAPLTVANFVAYVNAGRYAANFFHRSVPGFVIQNGGFYFINDTTFDEVATFAPVKNEPGRSNLRGTVAMAKLGGDPDSATSQWFINLADNSANLDAQNGGFTVFAHVLGDGMAVADTIAATPRYNVSNLSSAWTDLPLTTGALARTHFIETNVAIVPTLSHTVTSDDPSLVTATIENGALRLTASPSQSGATTIRLVTTDLEGGTLASSFDVTVPRFIQTLTFTPPASATFGDAPLTLSASASSGLPVTFTVVSGPATLAGDSLTLTGSGAVVLRATQPGNVDFNPAAAVERTLSVSPASQTLTFTPPASATFGDAPLTLSASASSGLPVTFTVVSGPATLAGDSLTLSGSGAVVLRATQPGNVDFNPAAAVERTLVVDPTATAEVALASRTVPYAGVPVPAVATTTPPGLRVTYTYKASASEPVAAAPTVPGVYTVTATLDDPAATNRPTTTATLTITKSPLTISAPVLVRAVGAANPALPLAYSGLVGGDTAATALTRAPVATTKATAKSAPGTYPITLTGGASAHYDLTLVPGTLTVVGFGGTYEALVVDGRSMPAGKLTVTVPATALTYSGTLTLARETKTITIASSAKSPGTTAFVGSPDLANAAATWTRNAPGRDALSLALTVSADDSLTGSLDRNGEPFATLAFGARQRIFAKGQTAPGAGANTLVLHPAYNLFADGPLPGGAGFATAPIAASTGVLTLKGSTADGARFTASLKPTLASTYLLWVNPYGTRTESFLAGALPLQAHPETSRFPGRAYIPRDAGLLTWQKVALPSNTATSKLDKSHRAGFGPLGVDVSLDPWLPPATRAAGLIPAGTLAQRLGLAADGALTLSHGPEDLDLGARETLLPVAATLSPSGVLTATNAAATAWKIKITPTTGAFTGSFTLRDPAPTATKPSATVDRKVAFSGVLRQAPTDETEVGAGFFLVPGLPVPKGTPPAEQPSGEIRFSAP